MNKIIIKTPIWGTKSVGVAARKVISSTVCVNIDYRDKHGNLVYPGDLLMWSSDVKKYPVQKVKGTKLYIVPIEDFRVEELV